MNTTELFTAEELRELNRLCGEATPGPWYAGYDNKYQVFPGGGRHGWICECGYHGGSKNNDAEFIAAARLALPKLITEVFGLRTENERLRNENAIEAARAEKYRMILGKYFGVSDLLTAAEVEA